MFKFLPTLFLALILAFTRSPVLATTLENDLPECIVITHCVRQDFESSDLKTLFKKAVKVVDNTPRTKIIVQTDDYIQAEAKTMWRRYTDDLLLKVIPEKGIIQVRSESRVGVGDKGVNKRRVDNLAYRLMLNQP